MELFIKEQHCCVGVIFLEITQPIPIMWQQCLPNCSTSNQIGFTPSIVVAGSLSRWTTFGASHLTNKFPQFSQYSHSLQHYHILFHCVITRRQWIKQRDLLFIGGPKQIVESIGNS